MEKAKISVIQLFALMFMFEIGTTLVINYGIEAQKDAWLAILLGMFGGVCLIFHLLLLISSISYSSTYRLCKKDIWQIFRLDDWFVIHPILSV